MKRIIAFVFISLILVASTGCAILSTKPTPTTAIKGQTAKTTTKVPATSAATTRTTIATTTTPVKTTDFFSDQMRVDKYYESLEKYKFSSILTLVNEYIAQNKLEQADFAHTVKAVVEPLVQVIGNCLVKYDEFEEEYTVYYKGIQSISKTVNIVPFTSTIEESYIVGFVRAHWLFFESVEIKIGTDDYVYDSWHSWDMDRTVISGGVKESAEAYLSDEDIEKIIKASNPVMRFYDDDENKYLDHAITIAERKAIEAIHKIAISYVELNLMPDKWKNG